MAKLTIKITESKRAPGEEFYFDLLVRGKSVLQCGPSRVIGDREQCKREAEYQADALGFIDGVDFNAD